MSDRRGFSMVLALGGLAVMGVFVFAFATYSRNELLLVRRMLEHKQAEYLAASGLEWARAQLQQRRWYAAENRYWGVHTEQAGGTAQGTLKVVCEDMRHPEIRKYLYREAAMLSHVNVYSQGTCGARTVLMYGRYVMSPMPWLRSDSTDGAPETDQASDLGQAQAGVVTVKVPLFPFEGGYLDGRVDAVHVAEGQTVAINQPLVQVMLLGTEQPTEVTAPVPGKVKAILVAQGDVRPGDAPLVLLEPADPGAAETVPFTLKLMVRITKLVQPDLASLDIEQPADREAIRAEIAAQSVSFLDNHVRLRDTAPAANGAAVLPPNVGLQQVLTLLPAPAQPAADPTLAGNTFIADRFFQFAWPCTPVEESDAARQAVNFVLDLQPPKSNPLVRQLFAATGTPYNTSNPVRAVPGPAAARQLLNVTGVPLSDPDFVNNAGISRAAQWGHSARWSARMNVGEGGFDASTLGPGVNLGGVFYRGASCSQRAYDRPYYLHTEPGGGGKRIKVGHVLNFYRMFFTEAGAVAPTQPIRVDLDIMDRIVNPPPGPTPMGGGASDLG